MKARLKESQRKKRETEEEKNKLDKAYYRSQKAEEVRTCQHIRDVRVRHHLSEGSWCACIQNAPHTVANVCLALY
jgi:hypothetical protein